MALQFDTAVPSGTPAANCVVCKKPVGDAYYTAGKAIVCAPCKARVETAKPAQPTPGVIARATLFGVGGAILGALLYYVVLRATGYEIGLVAIAVGFIVGRAVQMGANGQRGRALQIAAVVLTGFGIGFGYLATGTLGGSWFTVLFIAIGVRQAWFMNRQPPTPVFHGPFKIGAAAT
jgi:hypothetical protein